MKGLNKTIEKLSRLIDMVRVLFEGTDKEDFELQPTLIRISKTVYCNSACFIPCSIPAIGHTAKDFEQNNTGGIPVSLSPIKRSTTT
jgi:hypothetical protein